MQKEEALSSDFIASYPDTVEASIKIFAPP